MLANVAFLSCFNIRKKNFSYVSSSKTVMSFANNLYIFSNDAALYTNDIKWIFPVRKNKRPTNNNEMVFVNKRSLFINIKCYALVSVLSLPQYYSEQFYFSPVLCGVCVPMMKIILSKHNIAHSVLCTLHKMSIQFERRERARACRCTSRFYLIWKVEKKSAVQLVKECIKSWI